MPADRKRDSECPSLRRLLKSTVKFEVLTSSEAKTMKIHVWIENKSNSVRQLKVHGSEGLKDFFSIPRTSLFRKFR